MKWWENGEEWTTRDGRVLKITEMDRSHLENTMAMIRRRAHLVGSAVSWRMILDTLGMGGDDPSDGVFYSILEIERQANWIMEHPREWMERTPVMVAMKAALEAKS